MISLMEKEKCLMMFSKRILLTKYLTIVILIILVISGVIMKVISAWI